MKFKSLPMKFRRLLSGFLLFYFTINLQLLLLINKQISGNTVATIKQCNYLGPVIQENGSTGLEIENRTSE
jgi:hypothetical protein